MALQIQFAIKEVACKLNLQGHFKKNVTIVKTYYRQRLPHIQPIGATFFVTFRLFGSIPSHKVVELNDKYELELAKANLIENIGLKNTSIFNLRKKYIFEIDEVINTIKSGPHYLKEQEILQFVKNELHRFDGQFYNLLAYSIMSNHVHIVIDTSIQVKTDETNFIDESNIVSLDTIMKRIKAPIARYSNKILNRSGQFWENESYDIYIRNEVMLSNVISYVLENPVKAGVVSTWEDYPGNFLRV